LTLNAMRAARRSSTSVPGAAASGSASAVWLTPSPAPSEPTPFICSVISAAFLYADRPSLGPTDSME
jgi:hypothetical protein